MTLLLQFVTNWAKSSRCLKEKYKGEILSIRYPYPYYLNKYIRLMD